MLSITILCIGKLKEKYLREAIAEYAKRLGPYCKFEIAELEEYKVPHDPSLSQISAALNDEGKRILAKIPSGAQVVALCVEGSMLTSEELGKQLNRFAVNGASQIFFVIGGSWGLSDDVKKRANLRLSFSRMTFPHQLMRVLAAEQLYRAFQINTGGKYHK